MNDTDSIWRRLVRQSRWQEQPADPVSPMPPWLPQRVAARWAAELRSTSEGPWDWVSRRAAAAALVVMLISLAVHARTPRPSSPWEVQASESVLTCVLPR